MKKVLFILVVMFTLPAQAEVVRKAVVSQSTGAVLNTIVIDDKADWQPPEGQVLVNIKTNAELGGSYDFKTKTFARAPDPEPPEESEVQKLDERIKALEMQSQIKTEK